MSSKVCFNIQLYSRYDSETGRASRTVVEIQSRQYRERFRNRESDNQRAHTEN